MYSNNLIKGRIAETIVSEMLSEAGYFVYRFGYEGILQSLIQKGLPRMKPGNIESEKIRTMPDFIIMNKDGDVSFIEVKYRSKKAIDQSLQDWAIRATKYWPEAKLLLVSPVHPHFFITSIPAFARTGKIYPLEQDKFVSVHKEFIVRY